jgi:hypothetical protein
MQNFFDLQISVALLLPEHTLAHSDVIFVWWRN